MKATEAFASLRRFGRPVLSTRDAARRLRLSTPAASKVLQRLATDGLVWRLRRGLWSTAADLDPLAISEQLTTPYPAYVSLLSALHLHGIIEQTPRLNFIVSQARTQRIVTTVGVFSIHHLVPELFGGYVVLPDSGIHLATPEKALFDVLYLSRGRSRVFAALPEVDIPATFDRREVERWIGRIHSSGQRAMVRRRLDELTAAPRPGPARHRTGTPRRRQSAGA